MNYGKVQIHLELIFEVWIFYKRRDLFLFKFNFIFYNSKSLNSSYVLGNVLNLYQYILLISNSFVPFNPTYFKFIHLVFADCIYHVLNFLASFQFSFVFWLKCNFTFLSVRLCTNSEKKKQKMCKCYRESDKNNFKWFLSKLSSQLFTMITNN